jgi:hypothetical protein
MFDEPQGGRACPAVLSGGVDLTNDNFMANIRLTKQSLALRRPF